MVRAAPLGAIQGFAMAKIYEALKRAEQERKNDERGVFTVIYEQVGKGRKLLQETHFEFVWLFLCY